MSDHVETDELFGELTVHVDRDQGLVQVHGPTIPEVTLRRTGPARPETYSLIASRTAAELALDVAGAPAEIRPARGGLTRRSYRVDVRHRGVRYRLVPSSSERSTLLRDGARIGKLLAVPEAGVSAQWRPDRDVQPLDAALGYLLAASFGTGADYMLVMLVTSFIG